jgi:hypothetical protein
MNENFIDTTSGLIDGRYEKLIKDEAIIVGKCILCGKKYKAFSFIPASAINAYTTRRWNIKHRRGVKIEIYSIQTDGQARAWKRIVEGIARGTCYQVSKCYVDRFGITTYYLNVKWKEFFENENPRENYIVPAPKEDAK